VIAEAVIAVITGLDGSGFSGLLLVGASAETFSNAIAINKEALSGMGQIITIWVGGGTVIPWAVIPVAAICNVSPVELVRKNMVPVFCGIVAVIIATLILV
jgi:C4-dicarboxylate transporter